MQYLVLLAALVACVAGVPLTTLKPRLDGRIVGGTTTTIENHPYQVSLRFFNFHICGASVISPTWIVTVAHCVEWSGAYFVRAGSTFSNSGGVIHNVPRIVSHANYNPSTLDFDIAVAQVNPAFTYSASIQPIVLEAGIVAVGSNVVVTGWGATSEGGPDSTTLREVTVQIISDTVCNSAYAAFGGITARMICAGVPGGGKDACQGDSGGPLVGSNRLVGVVSWGVGCARPEFPGVYTRVSNLRTWILNNAI